MLSKHHDDDDDDELDGRGQGVEYDDDQCPITVIIGGDD
jgi:hypothetical protein